MFAVPQDWLSTWSLVGHTRRSLPKHYVIQKNREKSLCFSRRWTRCTAEVLVGHGVKRHKKESKGTEFLKENSFRWWSLQSWVGMGWTHRGYPEKMCFMHSRSFNYRKEHCESKSFWKKALLVENLRGLQIDFLPTGIKRANWNKKLSSSSLFVIILWSIDPSLEKSENCTTLQLKARDKNSIKSQVIPSSGDIFSIHCAPIYVEGKQRSKTSANQHATTLASSVRIPLEMKPWKIIPVNEYNEMYLESEDVRHKLTCLSFDLASKASRFRQMLPWSSKGSF